jgi:peptide/nickel transport system substrate-binding protein
MAAWTPVTRVSDQVFTLRRNPYFVGVDADGNQLPYIDEVRFTFFADTQALNLAAIAGDLDMQERHIQMTNYPVFKENEKNGKYRVITWPTFGGSDAVIAFNQSYKADPELAKLLASKEFRIALSYAVNRDQIKESVFLGLGEARQAIPAPWHPYFPGDEWAKKYTQYKPDEANKMLDALGLAKKDAQGIRLMANGKPVSIELSVVPAFGAWPDVAQLVAKDWEKVGVKVVVQIRERALQFKMRDANELQTEIWNEDTTAFPFTGNAKVDPRNSPILTLGPLFAQWVQTKGKEGMEPPAPIKRIMELVDTARTVGPEGQVRAAQEIFRIWADNVYEIGTVGLTPMVQGVVVAGTRFHNVPKTLGNDWPLRSPGNARTEQFFFAK